MANGFEWYGAGFKAAVKRGMRKNLSDAGALLRADMKASLGVKGTVVTKKGGRGRGNKAVKTYVPSSPGQPPRKRTGSLWRSVYKKFVKKRRGTVMRVGAKKPHGVPLEYAKDESRRRAFVKPAFERQKPAIASVLSRKLIIPAKPSKR